MLDYLIPLWIHAVMLLAMSKIRIWRVVLLLHILRRMDSWSMEHGLLKWMAILSSFWSSYAKIYLISCFLVTVHICNTIQILLP
jgi:hypothetical protein